MAKKWAHFLNCNFFFVNWNQDMVILSACEWKQMEKACSSSSQCSKTLLSVASYWHSVQQENKDMWKYSFKNIKHGLHFTNHFFLLYVLLYILYFKEIECFTNGYLINFRILPKSYVPWKCPENLTYGPLRPTDVCVPRSTKCYLISPIHFHESTSMNGGISVGKLRNFFSYTCLWVLLWWGITVEGYTKATKESEEWEILVFIMI